VSGPAVAALARLSGRAEFVEPDDYVLANRHTGHAKLSTTDRYVSAKLRPEEFERLDRAFEVAAPPIAAQGRPEPSRPDRLRLWPSRAPERCIRTTAIAGRTLVRHGQGGRFFVADALVRRRAG
jgi:hypothetical protein